MQYNGLEAAGQMPHASELSYPDFRLHLPELAELLEFGFRVEPGAF